MVHHLFPDFLLSAESYRRVERYWRNLVDEIATRHGQQGDWRPWQKRSFLNGSEMPRDGNPVFDARSEKLARAVRIIQSPPESDGVEIAGWIDTFDFSAADGPGFTEELVVNLALSEESAAIAASLLDQWMERDVSRERMEDIVANLNGANP